MSVYTRGMMKLGYEIVVDRETQKEKEKKRSFQMTTGMRKGGNFKLLWVLRILGLLWTLEDRWRFRGLLLLTTVRQAERKNGKKKKRGLALVNPL